MSFGFQKPIFTAVSVGVVSSLLFAGCSINPATGERQLVLMSESQEIAMGRQSHEQIVQEMGAYEDPGVQAYVNRLGQELAALSERPGLPWTFTVLDDPVVNAFALPGGYVYVTRGILTHLGSEAELVSVLGHEIGHVTGRHGVERVSKAQLMGIGLGVGMVLSEDLRQLGDLAQTGLGLLFLSYSRADEREADDLGLRYTLKGGWDAREMPGVFAMLKAVGIDGMVFGPDPRQGFFENSLFKHPEMAFKIDFPEGWKTVNQRQQVVGVSQQEDAVVTLSLAAETDLEAAAREFLSQEGVNGGRVSSGRIHGNPPSSRWTASRASTLCSKSA